MQSEIKHTAEFSKSKLYMWRTIIVIAHADGNVCGDERIYLENVFERLRDTTDITDEQYDRLLQDLNEKQDILDMLSQIEDPRYKGQVMHFAQLLAAKDGVICQDEQRLLNQIEHEINQDESIRNVCNDEREKLRSALNGKKNKGGFINLLDGFIEAISS